ncbi:hypothetical protein [Flavobacterium sp. SaA2.13]|nr:hypothetical protein [Flavobacterium sp. SaA2.13]
MVFLCLVVLMQSCALMPKEHRQARNDDFFNRFSKHTITAKHTGKFGDNYLVLRKNGTFIYRNNVFGVFVTYYCGTYNFQGNALKLKFDYDRASADIGDTLLIALDSDGDACFKAGTYTLAISNKNMYRSIAGI